MKNKVYDETTQVTPTVEEIIKELSKKSKPPKFDFNLRGGEWGIKYYKEVLNESINEIHIP